MPRTMVTIGQDIRGSKSDRADSTVVLYLRAMTQFDMSSPFGTTIGFSAPPFRPSLSTGHQDDRCHDARLAVSDGAALAPPLAGPGAP